MNARLPVSLALLLAACAVLLLPGCEREPPAAAPAQAERHAAAWRDHLAEHSQGWIGAESVLQFRFSHAVVDAGQLNRPLDGIVRLEPDHDVVAVFTAPDIMEVRHEKPFPAGVRLEAVLMPEGLRDVPRELGELRIPLQVLEQGINLRNAGFIADPAGAGALWLEGVLETADAAPEAAVERIVTASQDGAPRAVAWTHANPREHRFVVQGLERGEAASTLRISWDGTPIGVDRKGAETFDVPARAHFANTSVQVMQAPDPYVDVRFSEPLDPRQDLKGIARIDGRDARAQIDGNALRIYVDRGTRGTVTVGVAEGLRSAGGERLAAAVAGAATFAPELPAVRFVDGGHILPAADRLTVPFEAVAISAVRVRAFEIYAGNIGQYLQQGGLDYSDNGYIGDYTHREVGRYLWQKTIVLPRVPLAGWERFDLDVSELMRNKKGSLLRLELEVLPQHSAYPCETPPAAAREEEIAGRGFDGFYAHDPVPEELQRYYESAGYYAWDERGNPCQPAYYASTDKTHVAQLFFASSIGLLAKQGSDDAIHVLATDLRSAVPLAGAAITVFNYQQQQIGAAGTGSDGLATTRLQGVPYYVRAEKDGDVAWLKVPRNEALPTEQFNTGGAKPQQGLKGFFYGERDIWRPGDDIFLTFVLQDRDGRLPRDYPLTLEFFDPRGGKAASVTNAAPVGGFYTFALKTDENAPTGNWRAIVRIGDRWFDQVVKVENIAPNRLRMDLDLPPEGLRLAALPRRTTLAAQWLNGSTAAGLQADVRVRLSAATTAFEGYDGYVFDDRARSFTQEPAEVFTGRLDAEGKAAFDLALTLEAAPPGALEAVFTQRVFEPGGQFSSQYRHARLLPYEAWVGLRAPKAQGWSLDERKDQRFDLLSLDADGKPLADRELVLTVYDIDWRWWWEEGGDDLSRYVSDDVRRAALRETLRTDAGGHLQWTLAAGRLEGGRKLVRVCDVAAAGRDAHCSSQDIYLGWGWGDGSSRDAATRMALSTDRERYSVGDRAVVRLPEGPNRQVLVSIENGDRVLARYWQAVAAEHNSFEVELTPAMTPNVYVHVTQLQPFERRANDLPIRTYGIVPLLVDDPATHLAPRIEAPDKVRPEGKLALSVREETGRAMDYTLAIVDEGLLGITDFHAPDPHAAFYRREALGVLSWDLYDLVVGAYGADLSRLLALGGADSIKKRDANRERRFPPIVKFLGAFRLEAGATREHAITLPPYMGAVRVMVVAGDGRAFGRAERTVTVTQPLTLLSALPRVLGPGEEFDLPVTVFAGAPLKGSARIRAEAGSPLAVIEGERSVVFEKPGEQTVRLRLRAGEGLGNASLTVRGELGGESAHETVHVPVRSANLPASETQLQVIAPGASWEPAFTQPVLAGSARTHFTVSRAPEMRLEQRLDYLIGYPHGCIEQLTSAAFPQLYLHELVALDDAQSRRIEQHVRAAIERIAQFQTGSGGFAYWPYQDAVSAWGNTYAGHFLLEARAAGYAVPAGLLGAWLEYQQQAARADAGSEPWRVADQAYRLYTLALAGKAEVGAMNRLRDRIGNAKSGEHTVAGWMLALGYQQIGLADIAASLLAHVGTQAAAGPADEWYFGSSLRDRAVLLLLQQRLGMRKEAWDNASGIAADLAGEGWYSTQATAWALGSLARSFGAAARGESRFALRDAAGAWTSQGVQKAVWRGEADAATAAPPAVRNEGKEPLYVAFTRSGIPANLEERARAEGMRMEVRFSDLAGAELDVGELPQGSDFVATVTVRNTGNRPLGDIALTQVFPSGWQIRNPRLEGEAVDARIDHQDLRDDRVVSYFSLLPAGATRWARPWRGEEDARGSDSVTIKVLLNASFAGRFYLPGWRAEPMYDGTRQAASIGRWVQVTPR